MFICFIFRIIYDFISQMGLETELFVEQMDNTWYYVNGGLHRTSDVQANPDILGFDTLPHEKGKTADDLLGEAIQPVRAVSDILSEYINVVVL